MKKSARKKQVKCLIKVSEKIIKYIKGPLDGQTDHEDSLIDTNKPNEDEEKWGVNRKVKKLKRSWSYLKESRLILELSSKSRKISPKVKKKIQQNLKTKKRKFVEKKRKKSTKYK